MTSWRKAALLGLTVISVFIVTDAVSRCLSCTYIKSTIPSVGFECVNDSYVKSLNITCNFTTHMCYVKADYDIGYSAFRGLARSCEVKTAASLTAIGNRCTMDGPYPTCLYTCTTDLCNDEDGDLYRNRYSAEKGPSGGSGGMATWTFLYFMQLVLLFYLTL